MNWEFTEAEMRAEEMEARFRLFPWEEEGRMALRCDEDWRAIMMAADYEDVFGQFSPL